GYKKILEIEQRIKNNRENPWQKMIKNIAMIEFTSDQGYLIDFKRQILQNLESFEIDDMKSEHLNEQYYLIVDDPITCPFSGSLSAHVVDWLKKNVNNAEYSLFECDKEESWLKEFIDTLDESYTESSQQAIKESKSSSNSSTCSSCNSRQSSTSVANYNENTLNMVSSIYEELTFVNLSAKNFNLDNNYSSRSNGIHPDDKFICKDIVHQFGMEVDVLEVSKSKSSSDKKERD
ncbi:7457_t:CDS:2, partial [Cetraspora pellucida]